MKTYLTLAVDSATEFCFLDDHDKGSSKEIASTQSALYIYFTTVIIGVRIVNKNEISTFGIP
jgi:hypothetical protein